MDHNKSAKIGPKPEALLAAILLTALMIYIFYEVDEFTNFWLAGRVGYIAAFTGWFWWRGGHALVLDQDGIHSQYFGIEYRVVPWASVQDVLCSIRFSSGHLGGMNILVRLKGLKPTPPDKSDFERYHFFHPFRTYYIEQDEFENYVTTISAYTKITY